MIRCVVPAILFLSMNGSLLLAADKRPVDLEPLLKELIEKNDLPGASACIVRGDEIVAIGSAGIRKQGDSSHFEVTDSVHLGSDTKAMTALLIGQLVDRKQLSFDASMDQLFPELAQKMNSEMAKITVRDLLNHTAGLSANLNFPAIDGTKAPLPQQRRQVVTESLTNPPRSKINEYSYSNVGYVILGAIIESKTNQSWEQTMGREIFKPLGMSTAGFGSPGTKGKVDQPWGHMKVGQNIVPVQLNNPLVIGPAGLVHCSISDWSKFVREIMRAARGKPRLISPEMFRELTTPPPGGEYAGGWVIKHQEWAKGPALIHAGSNGAWYCLTCIAPNRDVAILIAFNCGLGQIVDIAHDGLNKLIAENERIGEVDSQK